MNCVGLGKSKKKNRNNSITLGAVIPFCRNPATSAYDISLVAGKDKKKKKQHYKDTGDRIEHLKDLRLIKVTKKEPNPHGAHYYILGKRGVHYIITNNIRLKHGNLKSLLKNYGDHPLFRYFLYPCIKRDILLKIGDSAIFDHVLSYLYDCYKRVEETIPSIIHKGQIDYQIQNECVRRRVFSWDLSHEDKDSLCSFLKQRFGWIWVDNAKVSKTLDGILRIKLSYELNSAHITLNQSKTNAALFFKKNGLNSL